MADEAFLSRLREPDDDPVALVIGGPGGGKTTSAEGAMAEGNIVFDGSAVHAERQIDEAVTLGRKGVSNMFTAILWTRFAGHWTAQ